MTLIQAFQVSATVSVTTVINNSTVTIYTAPANSYAIVNVFVGLNPSSIAWAVQIDGRPILEGSSVMTSALTVHVGPGSVMSLTSSYSGSVTCYTTGVQFTNT